MIAQLDFDVDPAALYFPEDAEIIHPQKVKQILNRSAKKPQNGNRKSRIKKTAEERREYITVGGQRIIDRKEKSNIPREEQRMLRQSQLIDMRTAVKEAPKEVARPVVPKTIFKFDKSVGAEWRSAKELLDSQKTLFDGMPMIEDLAKLRPPPGPGDILFIENVTGRNGAVQENESVERIEE